MIKKRILIVEDSSIISMDIKSSLEDLGYEVCKIVSTGKDAIEAASQEKPDLILMDIKIEGEIDGITAAEEIRHSLDIPLIYLTAYSDKTTLERAKITQPMAYIIKPFEKRELNTNIEMALYKDKMERILKEKEEWLSATLNSIADGVIAIDRNSNIIFMNPIAEKLTGWKSEEVKEASLHKVFKIIDETSREPIENPADLALRKGEVISIVNNTILISREGKEYYISDNSAPIKDSKGEILGVVLTFRDVSEKKKKEIALKESEHKFRFIAENAKDIIIQLKLKPEKRIDYVSPSIKAITGYSPEEFYEDPDIAKKIIYKDDFKVFEYIINGKFSWERPVELRCLTKNNKLLWVELVNSPVFDENKNIKGIEIIARDITHRKEAEKKLKYLSLYDPLTSVYNRYYFQKEMEFLDSVDEEDIAIMICDVDGLRFVNNAIGSDKGDEFLKKTANILNLVFDKEQTICRIGGGEFGIILKNVDGFDIQNYSKEIKKMISEYNNNGLKIPLSLSIGYAFKDNDKGINEVFKEANNNLQREKMYSDHSVRSSIVKVLVKTLEARDFITEGHADRLQDLVVELAKSLGLSESRLSGLRLLAQFHDIGKVGIPDNILFKKGPLTNEEKTEMKKHSEIGFKIAETALDLAPIADFILKNHEWWDGSGYPIGLKGEEIPLECRILSIADAYDAMTNDRPYRKAMPHEEAVKELRRCSGIQFDPNLVEKFIEISSKL